MDLVDIFEPGNREAFQLLLALWGAGLSTLLAFVKVRESLRDRWKLWISAKATGGDLQIEIVNDGARPVTITSVEIIYEADWFDRQLVWRDVSQVKLGESERSQLAVPRDDIVGAAQKHVQQRYNCRLLAVVQTSSRVKLTQRVHLDESLVPPGYSSNARSFVAADQFLGFELLPERTHKRMPYLDK